ncbi:uncharacterized protein MEPE_00190 [Melanopsichium pennsylvanicum]|uniref:Uncharacterized protein n=1 Tax=Melanopsichium pennsylvanicum TaxID=63383 RepID=A0AAJ4XFG2_9BASI|nr:uncharacterized protein MEPE_00190 [Melanopsichium pennsylvanicum]
MSQSISTPRSRRGVPPETPGSARSNTSFASTTIDRATLEDRIEDLELETHDLKRQIAAERERRRSKSTFLLLQQQQEQEQHQQQYASTSSSAALSLSYMDPMGKDANGIKQVLLSRLKKMDDEALTRLLTASSDGLVGFIASAKSSNGENFADADNEAGEGLTVYSVLDASLVPSKSVGVEGLGSASDIDRRLLDYNSGKTSSSSKGMTGGGGGGGIAGEVGAVRHAKNVNAFLKDREKRTNALLESLLHFTYFDLQELDQTNSPWTSRHDGDENGRTRHIRINGNMARLFTVTINFDVVEHESTSSSSPSSSSATSIVGSSPQIHNLRVDMPTWLSEIFDSRHRLYSKLVQRNDLPGIFLMLRTMIPLISLRRNLFTSLMESYTDLVRDHVRNWERENGLDFAPYHPPNSNYGTTSSSSTFRKKTASTDDESLARSLILPEQAESLILTNKNKASLTIRFAIMWNRFGHAIPSITAIPWIPEALLNPTVQTFLDGFQDEFQHLIKTALAQDGMIGLPDQDQDDEDEDEDGLDGIVGRFGILPGLHAVIKAFFGLENNHLSIEQDSSLEQE